MPAINTDHNQGQAHPMRNYVRSQLQGGADLETLVTELGKSGVDEQIAHQLVSSVSKESAAGLVKPIGETPSIQPVVLGGLVASLVAGAIWGGVALLTGREFALMALFVGGAAGYAVLLFSKGETSSTHQIIAVGYAILGILIGRYVTFYVILKDFVEQQLGPETASGMSIFSTQLFGQFVSNVGEIFSLWDVLWMAFACFAAWRLTGVRR